MRVGIDFDGVVTDCGRLKSEGILQLYGITIAPDDIKTELVVGKGILTLEQYRHMQHSVYSTREIGLGMAPVTGALEYIQLLQREGYDITVITSRTELQASIAREWLEARNLELRMVAVGGGRSKAEACAGIDAYIDDDADKLEPLVGVVPHRFLFSWGYNRHIDMPDTVAKRVASWQEFYETLSSIRSRQHLM